MKVDPFARAVEDAAHIIQQADCLLVAAGAGMGVDSGLPDFRGDEGFWRAYPHFAHLQLSFTDLANPRWFIEDPARAWGFYGHRYNLYRATAPHRGFSLLLRWMRAKPLPGFVFTSNVDGQFQAAGLEEKRILECHGSIHHLQCSLPCSDAIWAADLELVVDDTTLTASGELPTCPRCGALARPNILMFGDGRWLPQRADQQQSRYQRWLSGLRSEGAKLAIIELGAGLAVPTVRYECERVARADTARLLRINPREAQVPAGGIALAGAALSTLEAIEGRVSGG